MVVCKHLARQSRSIFSSRSSLFFVTESIACQIPRIQARCLHLEDVKLNLPPEASGKDLNTLFREGYINENVAKFLKRKQQEERHRGVGALVSPTYQPHTLATNPPSVEEVTLELLLASQAHLGHTTSLWHPGNAQYIFGIREGVHIISLEVTAAHLRRAARVVQGVADQGGVILFVGTRKGHERAVSGAAKRAQGYHLFDKWIPGTLTNGQHILEKCEKKVVDQMDRQLLGFEEQLGNTPAIKPDLVVCLNPLENEALLHECKLCNIPTIGIIDTNTNPTWVTYPIPANDDSLRCIQVIAGVLGRSAAQGRETRLSRAEDGEVLKRNPHQLKLPEECDAEVASQENTEDEDVIDLRDQSSGGSIRYAIPLDVESPASSQSVGQSDPAEDNSEVQEDEFLSSVSPEVADGSNVVHDATKVLPEDQETPTTKSDS